MYKAIYRQYRPETFEEMLGQEHIVKILKNQISTGSISHAYLFCGTRGTGKTTTARLLAKAVNCLSDENKPCGKCANCKAIQNGTFFDLVEIDAASNNSIDDIRDLRDSVNFAPVLGNKKVYIIDEVHMLSRGAFNGFLKTLEEPPEHVMFILATTEPQKLPQTILSRCMRMDFRRVGEKALIERMREICADKGVEIDENALPLIASNADGSVRDCLTLLDQCIAGRDGIITRNEILEALGAISDETYINLVDRIVGRDVSACMLVLADIFEAGKDARQVLLGLMNHYRNLLLTKYIASPEDILNMSIENVARVKKQAEEVTLEQINEAIIELSKTSSQIINTTQPRILLEMVIIKLASSLNNIDITRPQRVAVNTQTINTDNIGSTGVQFSDTRTENLQANALKPVATVTTTSRVLQDDVKKKSTSSTKQQATLQEEQRNWRDTCQLFSQEKPMAAMFETQTEVIEMTDNKIVVEVFNETAQILLGEQLTHLNEIYNKVAKNNKIIKLAIKDKNKGKKDDIESVKKQAEKVLDINVNVQ